MPFFRYGLEQDYLRWRFACISTSSIPNYQHGIQPIPRLTSQLTRKSTAVPVKTPTRLKGANQL